MSKLYPVTDIKWHYASMIIDHDIVISQFKRYEIIIRSLSKLVKIGTSNDLITFTPVLLRNNESSKIKHTNIICAMICEAMSEIFRTHYQGQYNISRYTDDNEQICLTILSCQFCANRIFNVENIFCEAHVSSKYKKIILDVIIFDTFNVNPQTFTNLENRIITKCYAHENVKWHDIRLLY